MPAKPAVPLAGVHPIAPTPFDDRGDLDLPGMRRVLDCMVDQGVDGICILANYSEQFLLTDAERSALLDLCLAHVAGRVPVIVTCSHFSTRIAGERGRAAAATSRSRCRGPRPSCAAWSRRAPGWSTARSTARSRSR